MYIHIYIYIYIHIYVHMCVYIYIYISHPTAAGHRRSRARLDEAHDLCYIISSYYSIWIASYSIITIAITITMIIVITIIIIIIIIMIMSIIISIIIIYYYYHYYYHYHHYVYYYHYRPASGHPTRTRPLASGGTACLMRCLSNAASFVFYGIPCLLRLITTAA